jgi:hypothetical protein
MKVISLSVSYNYFGDTVITWHNQEFNVYQYNCRGAKELLAKLRRVVEYAIFLVEDTGYGLVTINPAIPYLEYVLATDAKLAQMERETNNSFMCNNGPGAEIAGRYGY